MVSTGSLLTEGLLICAQSEMSCCLSVCVSEAGFSGNAFIVFDMECILFNKVRIKHNFPVFFQVLPLVSLLPF